MKRTIAEINERIKDGKVVVVTAEQLIDVVRKEGIQKATQQIDVVTTGTFGPMCSSGMYLNTGQPKPKIKFGGGKVSLNGVATHTGLAAADLFLGATALPEDDPRNKTHPGAFSYGGGHVIEDLVSGKAVKLVAEAYGTDCYPRKHLETSIEIKDLNEAVLFNPRNCYQNYNVAVNLSDKTIYTYMGTLKPHLGNANYCSAGQMSPLLKDPLYRVIGVGTRIFLGGGIGYVVWHGTQHNPCVERGENGVPLAPAGTLAVLGDLKDMNPKWLKGASFRGYGVSLALGVGIPIPILDEETCQFAAISDDELSAPVIDYSEVYPKGKSGSLGRVSYAELKTGSIQLKGKQVPTAPLSSYQRAVEIAEILKSWIEEGQFLLAEPVLGLPGKESGYRLGGMTIREI